MPTRFTISLVVSLLGVASHAFASAQAVDTCLRGNQLLVDKQVVYTLPGFSGIGTEFQTVDLTTGASALTNTDPPFRVEVKQIAKDEIHLRLTTQDRLWTETHVKNGYAVTLPVGGKGQEESVIFGVIPKIKPDNAGVVSVSIRKGAGSTFESGPVWDPSENRLAFVELSAEGQRSLVLLSMADDKPVVEMRKRLPIGGPVSMIEFSSASRLRIVGKARVYELPIPLQGKVQESTRYETRPALPSELLLKAEKRACQ